MMLRAAAEFLALALFGAALFVWSSFFGGAL
jgi:hypothetical protein